MKSINYKAKKLYLMSVYCSVVVFNISLTQADVKDVTNECISQGNLVSEEAVEVLEENSNDIINDIQSQDLSNFLSKPYNYKAFRDYISQESFNSLSVNDRIIAFLVAVDNEDQSNANLMIESGLIDDFSNDQKVKIYLSVIAKGLTTVSDTIISKGKIDSITADQLKGVAIKLFSDGRFSISAYVLVDRIFEDLRKATDDLKKFEENEENLKKDLQEAFSQILEE